MFASLWERPERDVPDEFPRPSGRAPTLTLGKLAHSSAGLRPLVAQGRNEGASLPGSYNCDQGRRPEGLAETDRTLLACRRAAILEEEEKRGTRE